MESPWSTSQARYYIIDLLESVHELHFLDNEIISAACKYIKKYDIKKYDIYDHLLAYSMKFYGIDKIVTLNKADFDRYDFIKEIIAPSSWRLKVQEGLARMPKPVNFWKYQHVYLFK